MSTSTDPSAYEEWRISLVLPPGKPPTGEFVARLREAAPGSVAIHRKGRRGVRVYARSQSDLAAAEKEVNGLLADYRLQQSYEVRRWNPAEERWQSPLQPIGTTYQQLPAEWAELDDAAWEIRLTLGDYAEAQHVTERLRRNGAPVISRGWKQIMVGVDSEAAARQKAAELRLLARGGEIEVRPLSWYRRWLLRQGMVGNYADLAAEGWTQRRTRELNEEDD
jgi:hypothetical protein